MDPLTTAIIAGATAALAETTQTAIKDAYQGLKGALIRWFADRAEAQAALQKIEQSPDDAQAQQALDVIVLSQQQTSPPQDDLRPLLTALVNAIQQHGQPPEQQRIGVLIEALKNKDLKFGSVQTPAQPGIGVKIGTAEAESISFGSVGEP